ncbi:hypothetical protein [Mucilaginibacter sp. OK283]|jgi:hypothetical protein|uniref:hypothetical protein n=1 Tax=Mucilaginibacter sp. OK283 TaxID=1881049 RepID=UPI0008C468D9|nr:hypothetical protein [Mucilaginibacter sp. OK283]SEP44157.1 hypothetical protein SAMN05428947_11986 [Mucilaginibacter sp. OK283]
MNKLLQLILALLIFASCRHPKPKPINKLYVPSDEAAVTTLAFNYIMPSDSTLKKHLIKYKFPASETDNIEQLKSQLDTARLYVFIADTLMRIPEDYLKKQAKDRHRNDKDIVKNMLVDSWAPEVIINEKPGIFQLKNLAFTYNYEYSLYNQRKKLPPVFFNAGMFRMSAVFFNHNKTKAFAYIEKRGGLVVAQGYDIFLEKKKGNWFVVLCDIDWSS